MLKIVTVIFLIVTIFFAHLITFKQNKLILLQEINSSKIHVLEEHVQELMKYKALHQINKLILN